MWFAFLIGMLAMATSLTGDGAEEIVRKIPGITENLIEQHVTYAVFYMIAMSIIGIIAIVGLFLSRASTVVLHKFVILVFILSIMATYLAVMTSYTGVEIRHAEIQNTV